MLLCHCLLCHCLLCCCAIVCCAIVCCVVLLCHCLLCCCAIVVGILSLQDTEQESWLSCLQPLYDVKALSSEDPANLAKGVGLKE